MIDRRLMAFTQWSRPVNLDAQVRHAYTLALVTWPSGVRTLRFYQAPAIVTAMDVRRAGTDIFGLLVYKTENLALSLREHMRAIHPPGWLVVEKRGRKQARRVRSVAWMHPNSYAGPAPAIGDRV